jgi:peptide/nickel transport system ATP-binding protein
MNDETLLRIHGLSVDFQLAGRETVAAVRGVSFEVRPQSTVALVGESGSGKSATALAILGLLPEPAARVRPGSRIEYRGRNLLELPREELRALRGRDIAMVFQEPMSSLNPVFTVGFQLREALRRRAGMSARAARARAVELLSEVGIPEPARRIDAYPFQLSGGQQQRVMIATAIACEPALLIADEPTTGLDATVQRQIVALLAQLRRRHRMAMLFITHDLALAGEIADEVVVMRGGEVREKGPAAQVFEAPRDPYTRALLACRPPLEGRPRRLPVIDETPPAPVPREPRAAGPVVLEARALAKRFPYRSGLFSWKAHEAVRGATFALARGRTLGLVGESGSGKSTLAHMLVRLEEPSGGEVRFGGEDLRAMGRAAAFACKRRIQIVFQNPFASLNPRLTVGHLLEEPMRIHGIGAGGAGRRAAAAAVLRRVGLPESSLERYPHEFSGGQRQRIAIARCLTLTPEVLILDEPVSALDVSVQAQLLNLLLDLQDETGMSYLFISHDLAVVRYIADDVMVMSEGEIVEIAGCDEIYRHPRHPYTQALLASMPRGWQRAG